MDADTKQWRHGTTGGYTNHGCRCDDCRAAVAAYMRGWRARAAGTGTDHGTISSYTNHRCRCQACRTAWAAYSRRRRTRELS